MSGQGLLLFEDEVKAPEPPPHQRHSATSRAAAESVRERTASLEDRVLHWLQEHGPATDLQMMEALGLNVSNGVPRRVALMQRGMVRDTGRRHTNPSGREAVLWEAVRPGGVPLAMNATPGTPHRRGAAPRTGRPLRHTGEIIEQSYVQGGLPDKKRRKALLVGSRTLRQRMAHTVGELVWDGRAYAVNVGAVEEVPDDQGIRLRLRSWIALKDWTDCEVGECCACEPRPAIPYGSEAVMTSRTASPETDGRIFRPIRFTNAQTVWVRTE